VAGSLKPVESRKRIDLGAPVEGRRFGSGKSVSLTRERRKRSWLLESVRGSPTPGGYGARQGASEVGRQPRAWPKTPGRGGAAREAVPGSQLAERRTEPCTDRPKLEARRQARAQPGSDCRKTVRRRTEESNPLCKKREGEASCGQRQRKLRARKSSGPRVLVSSVGCRGRREASSPRHRGEPRGKPRLHGVARCGGGS